MITKEELLKQETRHDKLIKEVENDIDNELKQIEPDEIQNNTIKFSIYGDYSDDILHEVLDKYLKEGGYKKVEFSTDQNDFDIDNYIYKIEFSI